MTTKNTFFKTVYGHWANLFECPIDLFSKQGIYIFADDQYTDKKLVLYHIDKLAVIRISPVLIKEAGLKAGFQAYDKPISPQILSTLLGSDYKFERKSTLLDYFLAPADFIPQPAPEGFRLQHLDPKADEAILLKLFNACTPEELDDADIILGEPDPVIMGLIYNGELVAYASHRYWGDDEIADMGVLIHPKYRGRGLGKAIVASLCKWCIQHNVVPMYRVFDENRISQKIPIKLGFQELIPIHSFSIDNETN